MKDVIVETHCHFDLWWPQFWSEPKNDQSSFVMIFSQAFERRFLIYDAQDLR